MVNNFNSKIITLMYPAEEVGIKRDGDKIIPRKEMINSRKGVIKIIAETLKDWDIFIKFHPSIKNFKELSKIFKLVSNKIKMVEPSEPADKYIEISNIIVGIPVAGMVLYTALLQCPEKPIIVADLNKELLGDAYKNIEGIDYVDDKDKFVKLLEQIRDNKYYKKHNKEKENKNPELKTKTFSNAAELISFLYNKFKTNKQNL